MISHTMLGTDDIARAERFYQALLPLIGGRQIYRSDHVLFWDFAQGTAKLAISRPFNGESASFGNGAMVALQTDSIDKVQQCYRQAIELGATCEGEPGDRNSGAFYGAYFRDLDGNKLAVFYRPPQQE